MNWKEKLREVIDSEIGYCNEIWYSNPDEGDEGTEFDSYYNDLIKPIEEFFIASQQQLLNELEKGLPPLREEFPHNGNIGWERNCGFNSVIYSVKALIQSKKDNL